MESKSDSVGGNCLQLTRKQPENLKDIPIMEEIEPTESENEDLSSSKVSSIPHEPDAQSVKSQDDESDKSKTVCGADDAKKSFNLDKELNEIEFIISNLFGVLEELSESVGCSKNIQEMKVELDTIQQSASNLGSSASPEEDIASTASSLEKTVLKAKACGADLKQCPVSEETFDKMVAACQQVGVRLKEISPVVGEEEEMQETLVSEIAEPEEEGTNSDNAILSKEKTEGETRGDRLTAETLLSQDSNPSPSNLVPFQPNSLPHRYFDQNKLIALYFLHIFSTISYMINI